MANKVRNRIGNRLENEAGRVSKTKGNEDVVEALFDLADPMRRGDLRDFMAKWNKFDRWQRDYTMVEILTGIFEAG